MRSLHIIISLLFLILTNCQTTPSVGPDDGSDIGVWEGKVRMLDQKRNKKIWGYVTWISDSSEARLRVDVTAVFDVPIATFIMQPDQTELWLYQENKHYTSEDSEKLFSTLVKFNLDPKVFFSILSKTGRLSKPWSCSGDKEKIKCKHERVRLALDNHGENIRKVTIKRASKLLKMHLQRSKVQVNDGMFKHSPSSQFERVNI